MMESTSTGTHEAIRTGSGVCGGIESLESRGAVLVEFLVGTNTAGIGLKCSGPTGTGLIWVRS